MAAQPSGPAVAADRPAGLVDDSRGRAAFALVRSDPIGTHPGKFVAFVGDDMLGPCDSFAGAVGEAYREDGRRPVYAKKLVVDDSSR